MEKEFTHKLAANMAAKKESLIKEAISFSIGTDDWTIAEITGRGEIKILHDKTEIFSFDGVDLLHFGHVTTEIDDSKPGCFMTAIQEYRKLYV